MPNQSWKFKIQVTHDPQFTAGRLAAGAALRAQTKVVRLEPTGCPSAQKKGPPAGNRPVGIEVEWPHIKKEATAATVARTPALSKAEKGGNEDA